MNSRPAGYSSESSDEDDEFGSFSFGGEIKTEKEAREDSIADSYRKRLEEENTPVNRLYTALINGNLDVVKHELDNGFNVNSEVATDWNPLFLASSQVSDVIVEELLKRGADAKTNKDGYTTVMAACESAKANTSSSKVLSVVQQLLKYGANIKGVDRKRRNALMLACAQGFPEVVKYLLPLCTLEETDNQGWTALFYAANADDADIVGILLEAGANLEHTDIRNNSIIYYAGLNELQKVLSILPRDEITEDDLCVDYDFANMFKNLGTVQRPDFQQDIPPILYGMQSHHLNKFFNNTNIDLCTFLYMNDDKLKELGINMSFQRNNILHGQYKFHTHSWKKNSIPIGNKEKLSNAYEIFSCIVTVVKHLTVMEATLKYMRQQLTVKNTIKDKEIVSSKIQTALNNVACIQMATLELKRRAHLFDSTAPNPADFITKRFQFRKNRIRQCVAYALTGFSLFFITNFC